MSALRQRMIEDMTLAGLSPTTPATYIKAVRGLAAHYHRSPDQLREEEVRTNLLGLRERGVARGTFKTSHYGMQFLKTGYRPSAKHDEKVLAIHLDGLHYRLIGRNLGMSKNTVISPSPWRA